MEFPANSPFYQLLATKYDLEREQEALEMLNRNPQLATLEWPGPDEQGQPFVRGSTALHYAANDGKLALMTRLVELGADVNASNACWFRSVLSWGANNARIEAIQWLLDNGASPASLDALHAAAWGGSSSGADVTRDYVATLRLLIDAGADVHDRRHFQERTSLRVAMDSGHQRAISYLRSIGGTT